jgi:hypothetical protein
MDKDKITIIIADFGFSKIVTLINDLLKTFCRILIYATLDVFPSRSDGYRAKVDI